MPEAYRRIAADATGQLGSFTRAQALAAGWTESQLRSRVQSGILDRVGPNTYCSPTTPPTERGALRQLLLTMDDEAWATGPTAAALHGIDGYVLREPFHVVVARRRNLRRVGVHVHLTLDLPEVDRMRTRDGIGLVTPARTVIELARTAGPSRLTRLVESVISADLLTEDDLRMRIAALRGSGRYGIPRLLDVLDGADVARGAESWLERRFLREIAAVGLPRPETQRVLGTRNGRLIRVDCWFPHANLMVELLGHRWHRTRAQLQADSERMNRLMLDGRRVLQFTYHDVVDDLGSLIAQLRAALPH